MRNVCKLFLALSFLGLNVDIAVAQLTSVTEAQAAGQTEIVIPADSTNNEDIMSHVTINGTHVEDRRNGGDGHLFFNYHPGASQANANPINCFYNLSGVTPTTATHTGCRFTNDIRPGSGWLVSGAPSVGVADWVQTWYGFNGIHQARTSVLSQYGLGDTGGHYIYMHLRTGEHDGSAEGNVGQSVEMYEDPNPTGTITSKPAANQVKANFISNAGNIGVGHTLLSVSEVGASGHLLGQASQGGLLLNYVTTDDMHPVSKAYGFLTADCGVVTNIDQPQPTGCTFTTTAGFGTFVGGGASTVCVGDYRAPEQVAVSKVLGGSITMSLGFAHPAGTPIYQGGMCGYHIVLGYGSITPYNSPYATSFFIAGSRTATTLDYVYIYKQGQNGNMSLPIPNYHVNLAGLSRSGSTVTGYGYVGNIYNFVGESLPSGTQFQITGASDRTFNGTFSGPITTGPGLSITFTMPGSGTSAPGTAYLSFYNYNNYYAYCGAATSALPTATMEHPWGDGTVQVNASNCSWPSGQSVFQAADQAQDWLGHRFLMSAQNASGQQKQIQISSVLDGPGLADMGVHFDLHSDDGFSMYQSLGGTHAGHSLLNTDDIYQHYFTLGYPPLWSQAGNYIFKIGAYPTGWPQDSYQLFNLQMSDGSYCTQYVFTHEKKIQWSGCQIRIDNIDVGTSTVNGAEICGNSQSIPCNPLASVRYSFNPAANVTGVNCRSGYTCTLNDGYLSVTTGAGFTGPATLFTMTYGTIPVAASCSFYQVGGSAWYGVNHTGGASTTTQTVTIEATVGAPSATISIDYHCHN